MACFSPVTGYRSRSFTKNGKRAIVFKSAHGYIDQPVTIPCGGCIGCRMDKAKEWQKRMVHESKLHTSNYFVTFTYDEENLPENSSLMPIDLQLAFKRMRSKLGSFRFYASGEYGENLDRPHYHACFFGLQNITDMKIHSKNGRGDTLYTSEILSKLWGKGFATITYFTPETASYTARYVSKKITGKMAENYYQRLNPLTGEIFNLHPEFARMSNRPGIGGYWFDKFKTDCFPSDFLILKGKKTSVPNYYRNKLKISNPELFEDLKLKRKNRALSSPDNSPDRRFVREECLKSKLKILSNTF